jgi:single-strand selective monofunctional uracil DNA glycosylase
MSLVTISRNLCAAVEELPTGTNIAFTYNPLSYARTPHEKYLRAYGGGKKEVLLLGMNPGPFGMAQTGVPFGDVQMVREYLGIVGNVGKPHLEHPKRLVTGFDCPRTEVSGRRLWSFAQDHFPSKESFFERFFVANYCPLVFMEASGKNLTPDKLPTPVKRPLEEVCDRALRETVKLLAPQWVLGVGAFAEKQAERALAGQSVRIGTILHPSPASPRANRGWAVEVERQLGALGITLAPQKPSPKGPDGTKGHAPASRPR